MLHYKRCEGDKMNIKQYVKERDKALFSLDKKKIRQFMKKYDIVLPDNEIVFWGGVYKAICGIPKAPKDVKYKAVTWLTEHNMSLY